MLSITKKNLTIVAVLAALAAVGAGGVAAASGIEGGDQQPTGAQVDKAKQAAVGAVGGGKVTDVAANSDETSDGSQKPAAGETAPPNYQAQIAWNVDVTKKDGTTVTVQLDKGYKVLGTATAGPSND